MTFWSRENAVRCLPTKLEDASLISNDLFSDPSGGFELEKN